jgi:hypothetical protein
VDPFGFRWSSLRAYFGEARRPPWLRIQEVLACFGNRGKRGYRGFVMDGIKRGIKTPWEEVRGQTVMGSEEFLEEVSAVHVRGKARREKELSGIRELVKVKPEGVPREVEKYFGLSAEDLRGRGQRYTEPRYVASYLLRKHCLLSLREIGERVGLHYSAVGNAIRRAREDPSIGMAKALRVLEGQI